MENLLLVGLSQQLAMRRHMEIVANNIANMNTTAYRGESVLFEEHIVRTDAELAPARRISFVRDLATIRNETEGRVERTGGALDLGIVGQGFFAVETEAGARYTRNGHFRLDPEGRIVNDDGHALLTADGAQIAIAAGETNLTIARDGSVTTSQGQKGKIGLVTFANEAEMRKIGASLYETDQAPEPVASAEILQGFVEQSNVHAVLEMTKMMEIMRAYQSVTQLMERAEELQRRTIREVGQAPQS